MLNDRTVLMAVGVLGLRRGKMEPAMSRAVVTVSLGLAIAGILALPSAAQFVQSSKSAAEGGFDFVAPPSIKSNRVFRINRATGEVIACHYERATGIGRTECSQSGEGAGPQLPGEYGLVASHMQE